MKKLFSTVLFSILMVFPVVFMSCGDDDDDDDNKDQGKSNALIGTWMTKDSTEIYEGFFWYEDHYQKYEKDFYYNAYVKKQGSVVTVTVERYGYTFDGSNIRLTAYPEFPVPLKVEENKFTTPTTVFTRVAELPKEVSDKIAAGDYIDVDADDEED